MTKRAAPPRLARKVEALSLEQLRTLLAVADEGSFTAAARRLGHVQAAVSQSMQRLEGQLGLRLFDRSGRVPRLTARGEAIVGAARRVQAELAELESFVAELADGKEPELSVVVDSMFPPEALVAFARELALAHPKVFLTIHTETLSDAATLVRDKRASVGIAGSDGDMSELQFRHVVDVRMVPVVAPAHPLATLGSAPIDDTELSRHVQIVLGERGAASPPEAGRDMARALLSPRTWRVVDLVTKHQLLLGGVGWGHEPAHLVQGDLRAGRLVELRLAAWAGTEPRRSLALVQRRDGVLGPIGQWAAQRLATLCRDEIERAGAPPAR